MPDILSISAISVLFNKRENLVNQFPFVNFSAFLAGHTFGRLGRLWSTRPAFPPLVS